MLKNWIRKAVCLAALLTLLLPLAPGGKAEEQTKPYIEKILNYRLHYQQEAQPQIDALLEKIGSVNPGEKQTWERILDYWDYCNEELPVTKGVLPDGLPEDDSLCIVVMGYCLNRNGSMKLELVGRMRVALESAKKYPNAYILCTGGPTASDGETTEAGQMRKWLSRHGIEWDRIIVEDQSMSTTENALNSLPILQESYPSIEKLAIVTSDYHVRRSSLMFGVTAQYNACYENHRPMEVVGNAVYAVKPGSEESLYTQAWGIAIVAGVEVDNKNPPSLDWMPDQPFDLPPTATEEVSAAEEQKTSDKEYTIAVAAIIAVFVCFVAVQALWERRKNGKHPG